MGGEWGFLRGVLSSLRALPQSLDAAQLQAVSLSSTCLCVLDVYLGCSATSAVPRSGGGPAREGGCLWHGRRDHRQCSRGGAARSCRRAPGIVQGRRSLRRQTRLPRVRRPWTSSKRRRFCAGGSCRQMHRKSLQA